MTILIASEAGAGHYPENTNYALQKSLNEGVDGCELDFHLTRDKIFVAHHDYELNRALTRDATGKWLTSTGPVIKNATLAELQRYDLGSVDPASRLYRRYPDRTAIDGETIATLQDVETSFEKNDRPGTELWFEAKTDPFDPGRTTGAEDYAHALEIALKHSPMFTRTVLIAFDWRLLQFTQKVMPSLQTGFLTVDFSWVTRSGSKPDYAKLSKWYGDYNPEDYSGSFPQAVKAAGGTYWSPYFRDVSRENVDEAHELGLKVSTWGADTNDEITAALATRVDSLTTAYVDRARVIQRRSRRN
jgi:glycerophosphoryl diester phosphodiesterase